MVACVKWPPVVDQVLTVLGGSEPREWGPEEWHQWLVQLFHEASGQGGSRNDNSASPGRTIRIPYGLAWLGKRLGMLPDISAQEDSLPGELVTLGASYNSYVVAPPSSSRNKIQAWLQSAAAHPLSLPKGSLAQSQVRAFAQQACRFASDLVGRVGDCHLSLTRRLLSVMERERGVEIWGRQKVADMLDWVPNQHYLEPLRTWHGKDVRTTFGMSPLMVSACAYMWGRVPAAQLRRLAVFDSVQVLNELTRLRAKDDILADTGAPVARQSFAEGAECWPQPHEWVASLFCAGAAPPEKRTMCPPVSRTLLHAGRVRRGDATKVV